jgi:hypothetical protein
MLLYSEQHNEAVTRAVGHLRVKEGNYFAFNSNIYCRFADVSTEQPRHHMVRLLVAVEGGEQQVVFAKTVFRF